MKFAERFVSETSMQNLRISVMPHVPSMKQPSPTPLSNIKVVYKLGSAKDAILVGTQNYNQALECTPMIAT